MVEGFCELADVPVVGLRSPAEWWNTSVCDTPGLLMMHVWNQGARNPHNAPAALCNQGVRFACFNFHDPTESHGAPPIWPGL